MSEIRCQHDCDGCNGCAECYTYPWHKSTECEACMSCKPSEEEY